MLLACDATMEGVLAATGIAYLAHAQEGQLRLASAQGAQPRLGELVVQAPSAREDAMVDFARRVLQGFANKVVSRCKRRRHGVCAANCSQACVQRLVYATSSDDPAMPDAVYQYLRLGFTVGGRVRELIAEPRVVAFNDLSRQVLCECERTRQFVRFSHLSDGSFVASFSPTANTVPLVAQHFADRMGTERFCLVDPRHNMAAFHEAGERRCRVVSLDGPLAQQIASRNDLASDEAYVRAMWQRFYRGTSLPGRDRSQRGYDLRVSWMPLRLWDGLTELGISDTAALPIPERYGGSSTLPQVSQAASLPM